MSTENKKWQRNYVMTIYPKASDPSYKITITPPMTVFFNITHDTLASSNTGIFRLYNLGPDTRKQIFHDRTDIGVYKRVVFEAGYGKQLSVVFSGNIFEAQSYRQGTEWQTEMNCFDGGFGIANGYITGKGKTLPAGTLYNDVIKEILLSMPHISKNPIIGSFGAQSLKDIVLQGASWDLVKEYAGDKAQVCINNEQAIVMNENEYIKYKGIPVLDSSTGLLDTPRRQDKFITVKMLFEPKLKLCQLIRVDSIETENNETRKVIGLTHNGVISEAVNAPTTTSAFLSLTLGKGNFVPVS